MSITKDEEIIRKGYKEYPKIFVPKESSLSLIEELSSGSVANGRPSVRQMELEDAFNDGATFLDTYFKLHDVPRIEVLEDGEKKIRHIEDVSPYELPLFPVETDNIFCGSLIENIPEDKNSRIAFWGINLCGTVTEQTTVSWVHELTHTQLDSLKGVVGEFYNAEVLSMVMGNIVASILDRDEHMLRLNDSRRIYEMLVIGQELSHSHKGKLNKSRDESLVDSQYFVSDIKAYKLFLDYYYGSSEIKREILGDIQRVFDYEMTLEHMLGKYEVTADIEIDRKRLVKYFNR